MGMRFADSRFMSPNLKPLLLVADDMLTTTVMPPTRLPSC